MSLLKRAATIIEREATALKEGHTIDGKWPDITREDRQAHCDHEEMVHIARRLRERHNADADHARYMSEVFNSGDGVYRP